MSTEHTTQEIKKITVKTSKGIKSFWRGGQHFTNQPKVLTPDELSYRQLGLILSEHGRNLEVIVESSEGSNGGQQVDHKTQELLSHLDFFNTSDKEELVNLPGVGKATAEKLIKARPIKDAGQLTSLVGGEQTAQEIVSYLNNKNASSQ